MKLSDLQPNEYETTGVASSKKQKSVFGRVVNTLSNIGVGVGTEIGKAGLGLGELALRGVGAVGIDTKDQVKAIQDIKKKVYEDPFKEQLGTTSGKFGELVGMGAEFAAPSGAIVRGQQILSGAIPKATSFAGKIAEGVGQAGARFIPEATVSGGVELARTGGDIEQAKETGIVSGVFTTALGGLGSLARATYFPELEQSVTRALGVQGKSSAPASLKEVGQKVAGLSVLKKYAPQIKIKDVDGAETVFDPAKADFKSTVQAWEKASDLVYQKYNKLAEKAGEVATVDMSPVYDNLLKIIDEPRMAQYKKAAERLVEDMFANFPDVSRASVTNLQKYLKDLGKLTNQSFFAGISDIPTSEINAGAAKTIRDALDDIITKSTGDRYAPLRREYAALKSIENDLVRRFKQDARKIGGGLTDYVQLLNSGELIAGLVSQNPALLASGATRSTLGALRQMLIQPDRYLRRSFDLIDQKTVDPVMLRLFGGNGASELTPAELKLQQSLNNSLKNPSVGLSIQAVDDAGNPIQRSPNSKTNSALPNATPSATDNVVSQNPISPSKAPTEDFSNGAIPTTNLAKDLGVSEDLIKEARKYKSAEEFVKAQGTINPDNIEYHGTGKSFDRFVLGEEGSSGAGTENLGVFTTKSKNAAKFWAEKSAGVGKDGNVVKVYLDIKNPKVFKSQEALDNFLGDNPEQAIEMLKKQGFDAIKYPESGIDKFPFDYWDELASKGVEFKNKLPDEPYMTTQVFDPKKVYILGKDGIAGIKNKIGNPLGEYPFLANSKISDIQKINRLDDYSLTSKEWKLRVHIENYANKNDLKFNDAKQEIIDAIKTKSQLTDIWNKANNK